MPEPDRRHSTRYTPTRDIACLGWWEGLHFRTVQVHLRNISSGGALVASEQGRPGPDKVWLCLAGQDVAQWVGVEITEVTVDVDGNHLVHLRFPESCPYEVFRAAAWGKPINPPSSAVQGPWAGCSDHIPCSPLMSARQAWSQVMFTRLFKPTNPAIEHAACPRNAAPRGSEPDALAIDERSRSTASRLQSISNVTNLIVVFLLGVVTALNLQNFRALWMYLRHGSG